MCYITPTVARDDSTRLVDVTILFADLMNSVAISAVLDFWAYDELIEEYQKHLLAAVEEAGDYPIAEKYVAGDQLALFFYDPAQIERNEKIRQLTEDDPQRQKLVDKNREVSDNALFGALRTAILLKNSWLSTPMNMERVNARHLPFDVGIGIHQGICVLRERGDGTKRIEGYAINFAKRIEGYSRTGRVTQVMLSRGATERLRFVRRKHTVMRQRLGFISRSPSPGELKGLQEGLELFELKFFHKLAILPPREKIPVFEQLLRMDPRNIWAYHMAAEHYAFRLRELEKARELALMAREARPDSEKIHYDLATIAKQMGEFDEALFLAKRALALNPDWDLIYGLMAEIELARGGDPQKALEYQKHAYALCPDSPQRAWDLGEAYSLAGDSEAAKPYLERALRDYPEFLDNPKNADLASQLGITKE